MTTSPTANLWLTVPQGCRIEAEVVADDEYRFVFGDPRADGHTFQLARDSLIGLIEIAEAVKRQEPGAPALIINP
jgi:hypothetical protein